MSALSMLKIHRREAPIISLVAFDLISHQQCLHKNECFLSNLDNKYDVAEVCQYKHEVLCDVTDILVQGNP